MSNITRISNCCRKENSVKDGDQVHYHNSYTQNADTFLQNNFFEFNNCLARSILHPQYIRKEQFGNIQIPVKSDDWL